MYPPCLCRAVPLGIEDQRRLEGKTIPAAVLAAVDAGTGLCDLALEAEEGARPTCHRMLATAASEQVTLDLAESTPTAAGGDEDTQLESFDDGRRHHAEPACRWPEPAQPVASEEATGQVTYDELTGEPLPADLVRASRQEEVEFMEGWRCWERVSCEDAWRLGGKRPLRTRWVDVNKGDAGGPDARCRLVAKDFAMQRVDSLFAATPTLEALRLLLSNLASRGGSG